MSDFSYTPANGNPFAHLGHAAAVANHPMAPLDEVADAGQEVLALYGREAPPQDLMTMMSSWIKLQQAEQVAGRMVQKALQMTTPGSEDPKARTNPVLNHMGGPGGRYVPKQGVPFSVLKQLAKRIEVIQAIHRTRNRQVAAFSGHSSKEDAVGWRLIARDSNAILGEDHTAYLSWLTQFITCGGREFDALERMRLKREPFSIMLKKLVDDSLSIDHGCLETVPLRGARGLDAFFMRDSSTFMFATEHFGGGVLGDVDPDTYLVQEVQPGSMDTFTHAEMALLQRNPQTDLEWCGYGLSEEESSIETISNFIQALSFTREGIDNNAIPRGILMVSGNYDPTQMQAFAAQWQAKVRGAQNAFGLPMLSSRGQTGAAQFIQTGQPFSEMAFSKWISLQTSIACAIYGCDPTEINIAPFADSKPSIGGDDTAERLSAARDKGLRPFLSDIEGFVSDSILSRFAPWVRLEFTGLTPGDEKWKATERARLSTINEARLALGLPKHPVDSIGALPADPGILSAEFQRYTAILTLDEGRKVWGGLESYPVPAVGIMPLNPAMQAVVSQAMNPQQDEGPGGPDDGGEGEDGGDGGPEGEDGPGGPPSGFGGEVSDRLSALKGGGEQ